MGRLCIVGQIFWLCLFVGCSGQGSSDVRPPDAYRGEGLVFPDSRPPETTPVLPDGWKPADLPLPDAPPDLVPPDLPPPDMPPDLVPPDMRPPCTLYTDFSCNPSGSGCTATCSAGNTLSITCLSSFVSICICVKNGSSVGTCSRSGSGCTGCANAFTCCNGKW